MKRATLPLFAAALAGCNFNPPVTPAAGKAYFTQVGCASCHNIGQSGAAVGPDLTMVGFRHSAAWLDIWLKSPSSWKPTTVMPNRRLSPSARKAIIAYLIGLRGQDWPAGGRPWDAAPDAATRGKLIYLRAGCVACHGFNGIGGYPNNNVHGGVIPPLTKVRETYKKSELIEKIRRGVPASLKADPAGPDPLVFMPAWGQILSDAELDAVADYVLTFGAGTPPSADW